MTKKDYVKIASAFNDVANYCEGTPSWGCGGKEVFMDVLYTLSSTLKKDNPKFNQGKFITACTKEN